MHGRYRIAVSGALRVLIEPRLRGLDNVFVFPAFEWCASFSGQR